MIKIAALTRGYSRENDYIWKIDGQSCADKEDPSIRKHLDSYGLKDVLKTDKSGLIISRKGNVFGLLVSGLESNYISARAGAITVTFAFFELEERVARNMAVHLSLIHISEPTRPY